MQKHLTYYPPKVYRQIFYDLYSLFSAKQILNYGLLYNDILLCYDMNSNEKVEMTGIFKQHQKSIKKASKLQKHNFDALNLAKKVAYLCGL